MKLSEVKETAGSHVPVLLGIDQLSRIDYVLELGSGIHSTTIFLTKFKNLIQLDSYENNISYAVTVKNNMPNHSAIWNYSIQPGAIYQQVKNIDLNNYDLCLVDDSTELEDRVKTIQTITSKPNNHCLIVIHDFEHQAYKDAVNKDSNYLVHEVTDITPHTGILFKKSFWNYGYCFKLMELIK